MTFELSDGGRADGAATRRRLLAAATRLFSANGYQGTPVARIAEAAEANGAAINYHFGDKARLYRAVWSKLLAASLETHPLEPAFGAMPEDELRHHIRSLVRRTAGNGPDGALHNLRRFETEKPTGLVDDILKEHHGPARRHMRRTLAALSPAGADDASIALHEIAILAQTRAVHPRAAQTYEAMPPRPLTDAWLDGYSDLIWRNALAALRAPGAAASALAR
jgi:AcrR family transcriptional regulator